MAEEKYKMGAKGLLDLEVRFIHKELTAVEVKGITFQVQRSGRIWLNEVKRLYSMRPTDQGLKGYEGCCWRRNRDHGARTKQQL